MNTSQVMKIALDLAGMRSVPADSGIWVKGKNIRKVLFSIDAGAPEILLAQQLGYDLLIGHHPVASARLGFPKVVERHAGLLVEKGVPSRAAQKAAGELVDRIEVRAHPNNYLHDQEFARLARMPFMNIHLPIDQVTRSFLLERIIEAKAKTVGELASKLGRIPEFRRAATEIKVRMGRKENPLGNWVLVFAAGTNGGYPVAKAYFEHGVDTVIYLHVDYDELQKLKQDTKGNLMVLGHMAGDSIGINIFLRELARRGVRSDTIGVVR